MPFKSQYNRSEVAIREQLIINLIICLIKEIKQAPEMLEILPYMLKYGIVDWAWPLRFAKWNHGFKAFKYYSLDAHNAITNRIETKFIRDHYFPKKILNEMLFNLDEPDPVSVRHLMEAYGEICVITKDEDLKLRNAGLNDLMPHGWQFGGDIFARYDNVDIKTWENDLLFPPTMDDP